MLFLEKIGRVDTACDEDFEFLVHYFHKQQRAVSHMQVELKKLFKVHTAMHLSVDSLFKTTLELYDPEWESRTEFLMETEKKKENMKHLCRKLHMDSMPFFSQYMALFEDIKSKLSKRNKKRLDLNAANHLLQQLESKQNTDADKLLKAKEKLEDTYNKFIIVHEDVRKQLLDLYKSRISIFTSLVGCYLKSQLAFSLKEREVTDEMKNILQRLDFEKVPETSFTPAWNKDSSTEVKSAASQPHHPPPQFPPGRISDYVPKIAPEQKDSPYPAKLTPTVIYTSQEGPVHQPPSQKIGSIADYDPLNKNYDFLATGYRQVHPQDISNMNKYRGRGFGKGRAVSFFKQDSAPRPGPDQAAMEKAAMEKAAMEKGASKAAASQPHDLPPQSPPGRISDYEPKIAQEQKDSPYPAKLTPTVIYTSQEGPVHQPPSRKIGSIADYDPLNDNYGSLATDYRQVHPQDISNMNMYRAQEAVPNVPKAAGPSLVEQFDDICKENFLYTQLFDFKEFVQKKKMKQSRTSSKIPDEPSLDPLPDSFTVQELRSFLSDITMNPGKFERKIGPLTNTLNSMVDDDDTMRAIVNIIFDESVKQQSMSYSGARLCKALCSDLNAPPDCLSFLYVLLTRCKQELKYRDALAQAEDGGTYLRGLSMFMAELFSQLEVRKQRVTVLGDSLPSLIKTILNFDTSDNLKCACQILKLVGANLEDYELAKQVNNGTAPEIDEIIFKLEKLASNQDFTRNIRDMITSVIEFRETDWGRSSSATENFDFVTALPT